VHVADGLDGSFNYNAVITYDAIADGAGPRQDIHFVKVADFVKSLIAPRRGLASPTGP